MSLKAIMLAAAAILAAAGLGGMAEAADSLDQALPLDATTLNDVQTGVGVSGASAQLPSSDEMFGEVDSRMADANAKVSEGLATASAAVAAQGGNKDAEAMLYALPYIYSAVPTTVGGIEQAAGGSVGALGGVLDLAGALQGAGAGM